MRASELRSRHLRLTELSPSHLAEVEDVQRSILFPHSAVIYKREHWESQIEAWQDPENNPWGIYAIHDTDRHFLGVGGFRKVEPVYAKAAQQEEGAPEFFFMMYGREAVQGYEVEAKKTLFNYLFTDFPSVNRIYEYTSPQYVEWPMGFRSVKAVVLDEAAKSPNIYTNGFVQNDNTVIVRQFELTREAWHDTKAFVRPLNHHVGESCVLL